MKQNLKVTITTNGRTVETDTRTMAQYAKAMKRLAREKRKRK